MIRPPRVGKFEKVSYKQFHSDMTQQPYTQGMADDDIEYLYDHLMLPTRATTGSAGYDFRSSIGFTLSPGKTICIPTGIRVTMDDGWFLGCVPKSGLGFRYHVRLANSFAVIDQDYFFGKNEGHIMVKLDNCDPDGKTMCISYNDKLLQGIFLPFGICSDDDATGLREGGLGSTGA